MGVSRRPRNFQGSVGMPGIRKAKLLWAACALVALAMSVLPAGATSRIKDLANIEGVRQNQLIGYGLVVDNRATINPALSHLKTVIDTLNANQAAIYRTLQLAGPFVRL